MTRYRLLTPDAQYADDGEIERRAAGADVAWDIFRERDARRIPPGALAACDAMIVWHELKVDGLLLDRCPRCRIVVRAGVGFDHIDLEAAAARGVPVCNTPDYGTSEVADHAIALLLGLRRGLVSYHQHLVASPQTGFRYELAPLVSRLRGSVLGIVGLGRIGIATALRAKAFGMSVVCHDPYAPRGVEIAVGVERMETLAEVLAASDAVSLHCPLTPETRRMIDAETLRLMKRDAILINTARGAIVDTDALIEALRSGTIAGAGLDVLPTEPPSRQDSLMSVYAGRSDPLVGDRLIVTPHAAWSSPQSVADARRLAVETAMRFLREGKLRNLVNNATPRKA
jgi:lactate dehydrogenase-like 2-hydroxyacid dehydrogenase